MRIDNVDQRAGIDGFAVTKLGTRAKVPRMHREGIVPLLPPLNFSVTPGALHHVFGACYQKEYNFQITELPHIKKVIFRLIKFLCTKKMVHTAIVKASLSQSLG